MSHLIEHRLLKAVGAILIFFVAIVFTLFFRSLLYEINPNPVEMGGHIVDVRGILTYIPPDPEKIGLGNINIDVQGTILPVLALFGSAPLIAYLLWDAEASTWRRSALYAITVIAVGTLSWANFVSFDTLVPIWFQAILNLILAFCSAVAISLVWYVRFRSPEAKILKYATIAALAGFAVFLPIVFDIAYIANKLQLVKKGDTTAIWIFGKETVALVCAVGGLILGILNFRKDRRKVVS
jgi:hypothetical protein